MLQATNTAQKELNKQTQEGAKLAMQTARLSKTGSTKLGSGDTATLSVKAAIDSFNITKEEVRIKLAMLDYEMLIQQVKLEVLAKEHGLDIGVRAIAGRGPGDPGQEATGMFAEMDNSKTILKEALEKQGGSLGDTLQIAVSDAIKGGFKDGTNQGVTALKDSINAINSSDLGADEKADAVKAARMTALKESTFQLAEQMKKLGPEGEAAAAVVQGALVINEAFADMTTAFEGTGGVAATFGEKVAAGFQFAAAALGQISSMMAAESRAQLAVIDKQIEAEKNRDGKSKDSIAKIGAMEKKKEAMKKKAFEQDKKMKMAQTIASTAAGMIGVFAGVRDPVFSMGLAVAQAAIIGTMGAASLAMIAKLLIKAGAEA